MSRVHLLGALLVVPLPGCLTEVPTTRTLPAFVQRTIPAPEVDRCARTTGARQARCEEALYLARLYVRKLSVGDDVCLDGGFGEPSGPSCEARGHVIDTAVNRVKLEVRNPRPSSKWFQNEREEYWFEEGALVDLYLEDRGY